MDKEIKREAVKQYLKYFRVWFIIIGVLLVIWLVALCGRQLRKMGNTSGNNQAPEERVYDLADVLTDKEEEELRRYISQKEQEYEVHFILVTTSMDVEGTGRTWEDAMMNFADDFYDQAKYGYDKVHGDGALFLDNWYEGQEGSWLSTCGKVEYVFGMHDIDQLLDVVGEKIDESPAEAYRAYVDAVCRRLDSESGVTAEDLASGFLGSFFVATIVAAVFLLVNLKQSKARDTTNASTYVRMQKPVLTNQQDEFIRKNVTHVRIESQSSGGGHSSSHRSSGGGGHHVSSGGVSHGGGGRRR